MTACDILSMLHGRLGFCFGIVDGPLGGGIRLEGTWREGKVSKQKDTKRANCGVGLAYSVHDVYYTRLTTTKRAGTWSGNTEYRYGEQILRSPDTEDRHSYRHGTGPDIRYKALARHGSQ